MTQLQNRKPGLRSSQPAKPRARNSGGRASVLHQLRPAHALLLGAVLLGACAFFLVQSRPNGAQNLPNSEVRKVRRSPAKTVRVALAERATSEDKPAPNARPSVDFYTKGVRAGMFSAPQPPPPKPAPVVKLPKVIVPPVTPVIVNPYADWGYSGTVTAGDKKMALLENRTTKEGQYVQQGQSFMGAEVKSITDQSVTLVSAGKPYTFAKSDEINVTPLTASAAYLTAPPPQPTPDPNAAMQMQGQMNMGGQGMMLPNGRMLNASQAARFNNRMNRRFNGGGGNNGGYGGGRGGRFGRGNGG